MKYLYPYECEKLKLSNPSELQAAIDGNRREGRRPSYGGYEFTPVPTMIPTTPPHLNGAAILNGRPPAGSSPAGLWAYAWCCLHNFAFYNYDDFNNDRISFKIYHDFPLIQKLIILFSNIVNRKKSYAIKTAWYACWILNKSVYFFFTNRKLWICHYLS